MEPADEMLELPSDPMFLFLQNNKLEKYWDDLMQNGYDDYDYFVNDMEEKEVREMGAAVGMVKGHLAKLVNKWQILRFGVNHSSSVSEDSGSASEISVEMPQRIARLLAPFPTTEKVNFFNMVTRNLFNANNTIMTLPKLESYILSQRQMQYDFVLKCREVEMDAKNCVESDKPVEGHFTNIQTYAKALSVKKSDLGKLKNAIRFLEKKKEKANELIETLRSNRNSIVTTGGSDIVEWKSYELKFFTCQIKEVNLNIESIEKTISSLQRLLDSSRVDKAAAAEAENARVKRSKYKNTMKSQKELTNRHKDSAALLVQIVCREHGSKYAAMLRNRDFNFEIVKENINFEKFKSLMPRFHLQGLTLLLQKDVFLGVYDEVERERSALERRAKEKSSAREAQAKRRSAKASSGKQSTLDMFCRK